MAASERARWLEATKGAGFYLADALTSVLRRALDVLRTWLHPSEDGGDGDDLEARLRDLL